MVLFILKVAVTLRKNSIIIIFSERHSSFKVEEVVDRITVKNMHLRECQHSACWCHSLDIIQSICRNNVVKYWYEYWTATTRVHMPARFLYFNMNTQHAIWEQDIILNDSGFFCCEATRFVCHICILSINWAIRSWKPSYYSDKLPVPIRRNRISSRKKVQFKILRKWINFIPAWISNYVPWNVWD